MCKPWIALMMTGIPERASNACVQSYTPPNYEHSLKVVVGICCV